MRFTEQKKATERYELKLLNDNSESATYSPFSSLSTKKDDGSPD